MPDALVPPLEARFPPAAGGGGGPAADGGEGRSDGSGAVAPALEAGGPRGGEAPRDKVDGLELFVVGVGRLWVRERCRHALDALSVGRSPR